MSITVSCSCGQQFMAQPHLAGKRVACPSCGNPLSIPASADQPPTSDGNASEANIVTCQCGQSFKAPPHLAGKRVPCPSCGEPIDIPGEAGTDEAPGATGAAPTSPPPTTKAAPKAATPAPRQRSGTSSPRPASQSAADAELGWDDALATPVSAMPDGFGGSPAYAHRRSEPEPIQPMTMYAIWIGGGAVVLLILVILGHIIWKAFSGGDSGEAVPNQPAETAPAEPSESAPASSPAEEGPAEPEAKPTEKPATESTSDRTNDRPRPSVAWLSSALPEDDCRDCSCNFA